MEGWKRTLGILCIAQLINFAAFNMITPVLPLFIMELGIQDPARAQVWVGLVIAAHWGMAAIGSPYWGALADRHGKKPMMLRAAFGLTVAMGLIAAVRSVWQLFGARLLQGSMVGFGTAATALVAAQAPREQVGFATGLMQTAQVSGTVIGPLGAGVLLSLMGAIRPIFAVIAATAFVVGVLVTVAVREERVEGPRAAGSQAGGRAGAMELLQANPTLRTGLIITFLTLFSTQTVDPVLTLYIRHLGVELAHSALVAGLILSSAGVANVMAAPFAGRLADRLGTRPVLTGALLGAALAYALQALAPTPVWLFAFRFLLGLCLGGILPSVNAAISRSLPRAAQGRGFGLAMSASYLGSVFGPLTGGLVAAGLGQRAVFPVSAAVLTLAGAWVWYRGFRAPAGERITYDEGAARP